MKICLKNNDQLNEFFSNLKDFSNDDTDYFTTLNYVMDYLDRNKIHFIIGLDWKFGVEELSLSILIAVWLTELLLLSVLES